MNKTVLVVISLLVIISATSRAQHTLGIMPISLDPRGDSDLENYPKWNTQYGLFYEYKLPHPKWSWTASAIQYEYKVEVGGENCMDCRYGNLDAKTWQLATGMRYEILSHSKQIWNWYAQGDLSYARLYQKGRLEGGLSGEGENVDNITSNVGVMLRSGLDFYVARRVLLGFQLSVFLGPTYSNNLTGQTGWQYQSTGIGTSNLAQLRIGYRFGTGL